MSLVEDLYDINETSVYDYADTEPGWKVDRYEIAFKAVLLFVGICSNSFLLVLLYRSWMAGSRVHFFVLAICIADFLALCIGLPLELGVGVTLTWKAGNVGCKILAGLHRFGAMLAHNILAAFNVDNAATMICSKSSKLLRILSVVLSLLLTIAVNAPQVHFFRSRTVGIRNEMVQLCTGIQDTVRSQNVSDLISLAAQFFLPLLIIMIFGMLAVCLWCSRKGKKSYEVTHADGSFSDMTTFGSELALVAAYDIVFFLCWSCFSAFGVWMVFAGPYHDMMTVYYYRALQYPCILNSCVNPFIFAVYSCCIRKGQRSSGLEPSPLLK